MNQLGIAPAVIVAAKFIPAIIGVFSGSKKEEAEEQAMRQAQLQNSQAMLQAGAGVMATDVLSETDKQILASFWSRIRVAAQFSDINWAALGYPGGPPLSPAGLATVQYAWPEVRDAARFSDIDWNYHAIPVEKVAPAMPLPELGYRTPQPAPNYPYNYGPQSYVPQNGGPLTASLLGGDLTPVLLAGGIGIALLILFSDRR